MNVHKFGFRLAAIGAFGVPPSSTVTIDDGASGGSDGQSRTSKVDKRTFPLFVAESRRALELHAQAGDARVKV